jgi:hypothetical protein
MNRRFGGTCRLHLQCRRSNRATKQSRVCSDSCGDLESRVSTAKFSSCDASDICRVARHVGEHEDNGCGCGGGGHADGASESDRLRNHFSEVQATKLSGWQVKAFPALELPTRRSLPIEPRPEPVASRPPKGRARGVRMTCDRLPLRHLRYRYLWPDVWVLNLFSRH